MAMLPFAAIFAQDLIVTNNNDSLNCKIIQISGDYVYFCFIHENKVRKTTIPTMIVQYYKYDYFEDNDLLSKLIVRKKPEYSRWRLNINGGWSNRTRQVSTFIHPDDRALSRQLKSGYNYSLDATCFFIEALGVGLKYDFYKTSGSHWIYETDISIAFIGPFFALRFFDHSKTNCLIMNFGIGRVNFNEIGKAYGIAYSGKESTVGIVADMSYDIALSKYLYLGFQISYLPGKITEFDLFDNKNRYVRRIVLENEYLTLSRFNLGFGFRFYL